MNILSKMVFLETSTVWEVSYDEVCVGVFVHMFNLKYSN